MTFTATVTVSSGTPTGTVNFYNGIDLAGIGNAYGRSVGRNGHVFNVVLPAGTNSITAQYSGDSNFTSSTSSAVTVTVTEIATRHAVTFTPSSPTAGTTVTFTATITPVEHRLGRRLRGPSTFS